VAFPLLRFRWRTSEAAPLPNNADGNKSIFSGKLHTILTKIQIILTSSKQEKPVKHLTSNILGISGQKKGYPVKKRSAFHLSSPFFHERKKEKIDWTHYNL